MILIEEILVSNDIGDVEFSCNLNVCKGACCTAGDFGAPLDAEEIEIISSSLSTIRPFLSEESVAVIEEIGVSTLYPEIKKQGTPLLKNGACVFLMTSNDISLCVFEYLHDKGKLHFKKPLSCHLYPIRIEENEQTGFIAVNYDEWDICKAARVKGKNLSMPLFEFAEEAIRRKFGDGFYDQLKATLDHLKEKG